MAHDLQLWKGRACRVRGGRAGSRHARLTPRLKIRNVHPRWRNLVTFHSGRPLVWAVGVAILTGLVGWWLDPADRFEWTLAPVIAALGFAVDRQREGHAAFMDMPREWRPQVEQLLRNSPFTHDRAHDRWVPHDPDWTRREILLRDEGALLRVSSNRALLEEIRFFLEAHARDGVPAIPVEPGARKPIAT